MTMHNLIRLLKLLQPVVGSHRGGTAAKFYVKSNNFQCKENFKVIKETRFQFFDDIRESLQNACCVSSPMESQLL